MTLQDKRLFKTHWLMQKLDVQGVAGLSCNEEILIADCCQFFGTSRRSVLEYLSELALTGKILRMNEKVYSCRFFNADGSVKEEAFAPEVPAEVSQEELDKAFAKESPAQQELNSNDEDGH